MKKVKYLILFLVLFLNISNIYAHTFDNTLKVYDYAQVLTEKEQKTLVEKVNTYIKENNIDMVIVLVRYHSYNNLNQYINEFYTKNNFGLGSEKSGIIIALDLKENTAAINVFGNAKELYNDAEIKSMVSSINKTDNNYKKLDKFIKYSNDYLNTDMKIDKRNLSNINFIILIISSIIIPTIIVIMMLLKLKKKDKKIKKTNSYIIEKCVINKREEKFITTHTKQLN